jgi:hypothetical protein
MQWRHEIRTRRWTVLPALGAATVVLLTACGSPDLLDPSEEPLASERDRLVGHITDGLAAAADQLDAGEALARRVTTACSAGTDNWKIHDTYRSTCEVSVSSGFPLDSGLDVAFGGVDGLVAFEKRLDAEGWGSADWHLVGNDPGVGVTVDAIREAGRPVTDVSGVRLWSAEGDGTYISIGFVPAATPVERPSERQPGGYYGDIQGEDWQDAWAAQRDEHAFVVVGNGYAVLGEQSW